MKTFTEFTEALSVLDLHPSMAHLAKKKTTAQKEPQSYLTPAEGEKFKHILAQHGYHHTSAKTGGNVKHTMSHKSGPTIEFHTKE